MAGTFPAGFGPAGVTPVYKPLPATPLAVPRAVKYDPSVKGYVLTDNTGNIADVHPIDQIVATRATTEQGQSGSDLTLGQKILARWKFTFPDQKLAVATQEMNETFADLIEAGDISDLNVALSVNVNGAKVVILKYHNLRSAQDMGPITVG